ncbi:tautomerase family protein [Hoeflea alexandrii]|uniref:Tautomerase family protein n=1 Tax=Hoeflea alexandrii TaxID=288436 RepID=A0ABT1CU03_9HYPH|nr:tautomerase family protein [Hoeflea alexandrii]MCO6409675.1 tautomerase family protein [Hoeflea alexandrii]MCY0152688.1 tautomerase family protein [Hoeflea alexandrii]
MPLVKFNVPQSLADDRVAGLRDAVHEALVATANVPGDDLFHVVHRLDPSSLVLNPSFPGLERSPEAVIVEITFRMGRTETQKQALYRDIARLAQARAAIRPEDVMVVLFENTSLDWSFGSGIAHYALAPVPV